jgi:hypothetical protein
MKHGLSHRHRDTTRHGHSDIDNVKNKGHQHRYVYDKILFYLSIFNLKKLKIL